MILLYCYIRKGTNQEYYCWVSKDCAAVGLNLREESEISTPQLEYIYIRFCLFYFSYNLYYGILHQYTHLVG